jgi:general secretion pathway protein G
LEQLAELRYIRTIPQDPITKSKSTWILIESENPDVKGIWNIRSGAEGETREGVVYGDL